MALYKVTFRAAISTLFLIPCRTMSSHAKTTARVGVAQMCSTSSKYINLLNVAKCAGWAQAQGCTMLFLPENFGFMGESFLQTLSHAESPSALVGSPDAMSDAAASAILNSLRHARDGSGSHLDIPSLDEPVSLVSGLQVIARESQLWISAGGMHVSGAPPAKDDADQRPRVYNTHVIMDSDGKIHASYRKIHLFEVSIPGKVELKESTAVAPGGEVVLCDSPIGRLGLSVCYDLRFPELYVELTKRGAEVILVPSAFTVPTGNAHWHTLLRARAIETQCFVIAAAQLGKHNKKRESYGHSLVVDPWGVVLGDAGGCDGSGTQSSSSCMSPPSLLVCDLDLEQINSVRERMPVQQHRKNRNVSF